MPKFEISVELDGCSTTEEMSEACDEYVIYEALNDFGFMVGYVRKLEEADET